MGLGIDIVSGRSRVPKPPAMMTALRMQVPQIREEDAIAGTVYLYQQQRVN